WTAYWKQDRCGSPRDSVDIAWSEDSDVLVLRGASSLRFYSLHKGELLHSFDNEFFSYGSLSDPIEYTPRIAMLRNHIVLSARKQHGFLPSLWIFSVFRQATGTMVVPTMAGVDVEIDVIWGSERLGVFAILNQEYAKRQRQIQVHVCSIDKAISEEILALVSK